jgi:hypothetical protein
MSEEPQSDGKDLAGRTAANFAATATSLAAIPYVGPVAAAFIGAGLESVFEQIAVNGNARADAAARAAARGAELAEVGPDDLAAWACESPARASLLAQVVDAAYQFADKAKIEALAQVLAHNIQDDARLDLAPLYVAALRDLGPAHVRVLRSMAEKVNHHASERAGESDAAPKELRRTWLTDDLVAEHPNLADGMHSIVATLDRAGCIELASSGFGGAPFWWQITPFGRGCLDYLAGRRPA